MDKISGIIIFGPNGSGKTTLGRELARILGFKHIDQEAYAFYESAIPYTNPRPREECLDLMLADVEKYRVFVLTAVTGDFGDSFTQYYDLAVYLSAPLYNQHGERVFEGGDLYEGEQRFYERVASLPLERTDRFAQTLTCPVIRVDGTLDWRTNAAMIAERYRGL